MSELKASTLNWKRARRLVVRILVVVLVVGSGYFLATGRVLLDADGVITREYVSVSAPYNDSIARRVYVRPGDRVQAGQQIAIVQSPNIARTLADLSPTSRSSGARSSAISLSSKAAAPLRRRCFRTPRRTWRNRSPTSTSSTTRALGDLPWIKLSTNCRPVISRRPRSTCLLSPKKKR